MPRRRCTLAGCENVARAGKRRCDRHARRSIRPSRAPRVIYAALSEAEWEALYARQAGRCNICLRLLANRYAPGSVGEIAYLDHDHAAEKAEIANGTSPHVALRASLRALLCYHCNRNVLHALRDNPVIAERAARHLRMWLAQGILES